MRNHRRRSAATWAVLVSVAMATVGVVWSQEPPRPPGPAIEADPEAKGKLGPRRAGPGQRGGLRLAVPKGGPEVAEKAMARPDNPLEDPAFDQQGNIAPGWSVRYKFKLIAADLAPLAATYYPSRLGTSAAVVMMIHEKGQAGKDFEDPIAELNGLGLAEYLQDQGYAVLLLDLRGHGASSRPRAGGGEGTDTPPRPQDWRTMAIDLQAAYLFLLDRHNRAELNLARLGVLGLGEGANLATSWAAMPGAAVAGEGRVSDIAALALVSPLSEAERITLEPLIAALAPRVPILIMAGQRDEPAMQALNAAKPVIERLRQSRVATFPTSLRGFKLLRFEPGTTEALTRFFEATIKFKASEWEPRYNLTPVAYRDIEIVRKRISDEAKAQEPKAQEAKAQEAAPPAAAKAARRR